MNASSLPDIIYSRINFTGTCWLWTGYCDIDGYGILSYEKIRRRAHRFSWEHFNGEIPKGLYVLHKCDVRNCMNPEHLFIGNQKDNMEDMVGKGRRIWPCGEEHKSSKLKSSDVIEMVKLFKNGTSAVDIAKKFGVGRNRIYRIMNKQQWKTVVNMIEEELR